MTTLFLCFGLPKSGTTFLQRTLDMHPEISCPSEHQFGHLVARLSETINEYNKILALVDRRTGGQGPRPVTQATGEAVVAATLREVILGAAQGKPIAGANDNGVLQNIELYDRLLDRPRLVCIVRHPVDTAVSAWHHNLRLAEAENDPRHKEIMTQHGGFDDWVVACARTFAQEVARFSAYAEGKDRTHLLRYEDLVQDKEATLERLFDFLGATTSAETMAEVLARSDFETMKKSSKHQEFFREGKAEGGATEVPDATRRAAAEAAGGALGRLGYRP